MLVEFSVVPIGKGESVGQYVAECLKLVDASGLNYRLNPMGTVVEGEYDEVMDLVKKCHERTMAECSRVITSIKIDDRKDRKGMMASKIESVEKRTGKRLKN